MSEWILWSVARPIDTKALYRWRICTAVILGLPMRPEWSEKLHKCGMGYAESEWWPLFSNWNGFQRSVHPKLEWRLAAENEPEGNVFWGGLDLLPCPFTGKQPVVDYKGRFIGSPPYQPEWLCIKSHMVSSVGWIDAAKMRDAWNMRA